MIIRALVLTGIVLLAFSPVATALDGHDWRQLPRAQRVAYVMGIVDEWTNTMSLYRLVAEPQGIPMSRNEQLVSPLVACITNHQLSYPRLSALIEQHLNQPSTNRA